MFHLGSTHVLIGENNSYFSARFCNCGSQVQAFSLCCIVRTFSPSRVFFFYLFDEEFLFLRGMCLRRLGSQVGKRVNICDETNFYTYSRQLP